MLNFTLVQLSLWLFLYFVAVLLKDIFPIEDGNQWVMVGSIFPVLVCLYAIPIRTHLLPRCFSRSTLQMIDPLHDGDPDKHDKILRGDVGTEESGFSDEDSSFS